MVGANTREFRLCDLGEALEVQPKAVRRVVEVLEAAQYSSKNGGINVELKED